MRASLRPGLRRCVGGGDGLSVTARRWLEGEPAVTLEPQLRPGMRIVRGDQPAAVGLPGPAGEADRYPRRDAREACHDRHGRGELLTEAAAGVEDEVGEGIRAVVGGDVDVVDEA